MYPAEFDYHRADGIEEAVALFEEHAEDDPVFLSGGHSLLPAMKAGLSSPSVVIDIGQIDEMIGIDHGTERTTVGAATRYATVVDDAAFRETCPTVAAATEVIGDTQVRNRGTVGGNVAHSDPASDLPGALLAADATLHAHDGSGERAIDVDDFFQGIYSTALESGELLTRIEIPSIGDGNGAYVKKPSPSSGYAIVGVAARVEQQGETITSARVAANGAMGHAVRLEAVESALVGESVDEETIADAAETATDGLDTDMLMDDVQASGEYRAQLLEAYTERCLRAALDGSAL
jgi:carbon-monoxide dehydrogenase medium subunit